MWESLLQHGVQEWGASVSACFVFFVLGLLAEWWFRGSTIEAKSTAKAQTKGYASKFTHRNNDRILLREQEQAAAKKAGETKDAMTTLSKQVAKGLIRHGKPRNTQSRHCTKQAPGCHLEESTARHISVRVGS